MQDCDCGEGARLQRQRLHFQIIRSAIERRLDQLQDLDLLQPGAREKIAAQLLQDPSSALDLVLQVASLSTPAPTQGSGLSKSASRNGAPTGKASKEADPDGWGIVATEGA